MSAKKTQEKKAIVPDFARVSSLLSYDPETGVFYWLVQRGGFPPGSLAGCTSNLRRQISIDGKNYYEHRVAWMLSYGKWPDGAIDHIDGNSLNNRLSNLREATYSQNAANAKKCSTNTSGLKGVSWDRHGRKWYARICKDGKAHQLGRFNTKEEAHAAYAVAAKTLHGDYARHT